MELIMIIMLFVLTILSCVIFVKLNNLKKEFIDCNQKVTDMVSNLTKIISCCKNIMVTLDSVRSTNSPIKAIAFEINKIKDINDIVLKNQSYLSVTKNMVEETRNLVKSFKPVKKSKVNKVSSKEKSLNTEAYMKSQRV